MKEKYSAFHQLLDAHPSDQILYRNRFGLDGSKYRNEQTKSLEVLFLKIKLRVSQWRRKFSAG